jgi:hypothetical protein
MLTQGESVDAHALRARGWSVSAIARHLDKDRKTVRAYLSGQRVPGQRKPAGPDRFEPFAEYCRIRFGDDPHLWATTLFGEVRELKYDGAYSSFTRALRARGCGRGASGARRPGRRLSSRSSITRRVRRPSGTGWNCPARLRGGGGGRTRTC